MVFVIYVTRNNHPTTNVDVPEVKSPNPDDKWSFYNEKEVLLMPFFCFQVIGTEEKDNTTFIKIAEIPWQNLLQRRAISMTRVIWLDGNLFSE